MHESCAASVPVFRSLSAEALASLGGTMQHRRFRRGEYLAHAGDPVDAVFVIASGRVKVVRSSALGREQVVRVLQPGDFLGELGLFTPVRHEADVVVLEGAEACVIPRSAVRALLTAQPAVATHLLEALAERLQQAEQQIADLGLRDVGQRLAVELLRATATGESGPDGVRVRIAGSWVEVAGRLGTTPESLSRRLASLADHGIVRQEPNRTVLIRSRERLERIADGAATGDDQTS